MEDDMKKSLSPEVGDLLIVVDVQNDFLPGGALGVKEGDKVIGPVNRAVKLFLKKNLPVFYSRDWHPIDHCSFQPNGGPWPPHCVQDTKGAAFAAKLIMPANPSIFSKGISAKAEEYSAYHAADGKGRQVHQVMSQLGVKIAFIGGLATDYCVLNTALDLLKDGFKVVVLTDTCRAVNVAPDDGEKALVKMIAEGAKIMKTKEIGK
jgi:nicotinamidase-related amidase